MTNIQRIKEIIAALLTIGLAILMIMSPAEGYMVILAILSFVLIVRGFREIVYYFAMTRYMVGGRTTLYTGIILLDFGIMAGSLTDVPHYYILLYLIGIHAFSGVIEVVRALEVKGVGAGSWKLKLSHGIVDITITLVCILFMKQLNVAVIIYSAGLIYSSLLRIISACRKTKLVFIQ